MGAWPLSSLRQSFLNGSLTRLVDPDTTLKSKIVEFVNRGEFGLASGKKADGTYDRMWFNEILAPDEVTFEFDVFLLRKATAASLRAGQPSTPIFRSLNRAQQFSLNRHPVPDQSLLPQRGHCAFQGTSLPRCGIAWALKSFQNSAQPRN